MTYRKYEMARLQGLKMVSLNQSNQAKVDIRLKHISFVIHDRIKLAWIVTCDDLKSAARQIMLKSWWLLLSLVFALSLFAITWYFF